MAPSPRGTIGEVRTAWEEHRRYVGFAALVFALAVAVGSAMWLGGVDFFELIGLAPEDIFPEDVDPTPQFFIVNNTRAFVVILLGVFSLGLITLFGLLVNGVLVGFLLSPAIAERGLLFVVAGLAPHGVFELPAIFVAAGISFRLLRLTVDRVRGARDRILDRDGWRRTGLLLVTAWLALLLAAFIEAWITAWLLETFFA